MKQILFSLFVLMVLTIVFFTFTEGLANAVVLVTLSVGTGLTLGTVFGIPLIISVYGLPAILGTVATVSAVIAGILKRHHLYGQILAVLGIVSWILLGIWGMGHGG